MNAAQTPDLIEDTPDRRLRITPAVEALVVLVALVVGALTYLILVRQADQWVISPPLLAVLLVANLVSGGLLMMLIGRRVAQRRARRSPIGGNGQLHVRLVTIFSIVAAVPLIFVNIFASLLFQYGVAFWYSDRAGGLLSTATTLLQTNYDQEIDRIGRESSAMSIDLARYLQTDPIDSKRFSDGFGQQLLGRNMSEAAIYVKGDPLPIATINPYERPLDSFIDPSMTAKIDAGASQVVIQAKDRAAVLLPFAYAKGAYLYVARVFDPLTAQQWRRGEQLVADYRAMQLRSRSLQLWFNAALLVISLLIVGFAVWIALKVADRLVRPVGELVDAARRVAGGDLSVRVPDPRTRDEVGTLAKAFNQMTGRLQEQNTALVTANDQLDNRRALIEAVMAGVSAGVIAVAEDGTVRIANRSATTLIGTGEDGLVGRPLTLVAPEFADLVGGREREAIVQVARGGEPRTLAVRIARTDSGPILTFDDITQQLLDQRRAAWSDVARRIAHEIKNPLTPIQLAAERLQRRYGSKIDPEDTTFARLTDTIVRQVGDLRRMVDEFSSFARMPKPVFREESLVEIARQSLFLHEVAHPGVRFELDQSLPAPLLVCDRRQLSQAFTNIVKNAVEAIESKGDAAGSVTMNVREEGDRAIVEVADTGVGLPPDRDRIVEPYMTTRARGTGLGLAIVKKIVEDHHGVMTFADREGGGTVVRMSFDAAALAALDQGASAPEPVGDGQLAALTRTRN